MPRQTKAPKWIPEPPAGGPQQAIVEFCFAVWNKSTPPLEVMRWLADCLSEIEDDHNHFARRAFGMEARGIPHSDKRTDYLFFVGLARQYGHTLESAIKHAAEVLNKSPATIRNAVRGMKTQKPESFSLRLLEQVLLQHGRKLPLCPRCLGKKAAKPIKRTPAKK